MELILGGLCAYLLMRLCVLTNRIKQTTEKVVQLDTELHQKE